ncbi:MAG: Holliday junction branch migration protein RuvA [Chloroflexi bacterium]|nr:Holliday junction branch migration protein RuvA [Chloroflexota bacterium]
MITGVRGTLEAAGPDWAVVAVGGVSLKVFAPASAVAQLGPVGRTVRLHTHLVVREDNLALYGFPSEEGLRLFELLLTVSGVGPKTALGVLSHLSPEQLVRAVSAGDVEALSHVPGVGKKTASRLALELKGKLEGEWALPAQEAQGVDAEVVETLVALGYSRNEARQAVARLPQGDSLPLEERVRQALQQMGSKAG